jgi:hypothetical protein
MAIQKARDVLGDANASEKSISESIDALRRDAQYVRGAVAMNHMAKEAGKKALDEIQELTRQLQQKLQK